MLLCKQHLECFCEVALLFDQLDDVHLTLELLSRHFKRSLLSILLAASEATWWTEFGGWQVLGLALVSTFDASGDLIVNFQLEKVSDYVVFKCVVIPLSLIHI